MNKISPGFHFRFAKNRVNEFVFGKQVIFKQIYEKLISQHVKYKNQSVYKTHCRKQAWPLAALP